MTEIADFLKTRSGKVGKREIARSFGVKGEERVKLNAMLKEMKRDGAIEKSGKKIYSADGLAQMCPALITGVDSDGELVARPLQWTQDGEPPQILITDTGRLKPPPKENDRVLLKLEPAGKRLFYGAVVRRLTDATDRVVGIYETNGKGGRITSPDRRLKAEYFVDKDDAGTAKNGDLVVAEALSRSLTDVSRFSRKARIVAVQGNAKDPKCASLISVLMHGIPVEFSQAALKQAQKAKLPDMTGREDLRAYPFVTVDGADARDFDDAVFAEPDDNPKNEGGYKLIVAIADVAYFVRENEPLDVCARQRGNSVYFPDRVVPMLPPALSNELCSLQQGKDRPCLAAHMVVDKKGKLLKAKFTRCMIRSAARLTYDDVQAVFDGKSALNDALKPYIENLRGAYEILAKARKNRHALEIDAPEREITLDDAGHVVKIQTRERFDSHKMIEEMMILANVAAAQTLEKADMPVMYRVHEPPAAEKVVALHDFLKSAHLNGIPKTSPSGKDFNDLLENVAQTPKARMINELVLRTQSQARYSPENLGHYGLALEKYAHFTSPIRRYADLLVHRALITGLKLGEGGLTNGSDFEDLGEHISATERRAQAAEREAEERYLAAYLADRVGERFAATINGVSRFGLFVVLDDVFAEGLVPMKALPGYFSYKEEKQALVDDKTGKKYELGQAVDVLLKEATPVTGGLIFHLLDLGAKKSGKPRDAKKGKRFHKHFDKHQRKGKGKK